MAEFYANPYGDADGFSFEDEDDFAEGVKEVWDGQDVEFSVDFVDGDNLDVALWDAVTHALGDGWHAFEAFQQLRDEDEDTLLKCIWLLSNGNCDDVKSALSASRDTDMYTGDLKDLAYHFVDEGIVGESDNYFDYESFGRDVQMDMDEEEAEQYEGWSDQKVGEEVIDSIYGTRNGVDIPKELLSRYFDYDAFARDLRHDYDETTIAGTTYCFRND